MSSEWQLHTQIPSALRQDSTSIKTLIVRGKLKNLGQYIFGAHTGKLCPLYYAVEMITLHQDQTLLECSLITSEKILRRRLAEELKVCKSKLAVDI